MANCVIRNWQGEEAGSATLELAVAREENASHIVHRALVRQTNNARQGTACAKTRAEVRGGGRKPWKQKGTGRARAGFDPFSALAWGWCNFWTKTQRLQYENEP